MSKVFSLAMTVRDYECDLQGIVNNAVYLNYLEHARHEFLLSRGISFARLHEKGIDAVVVRSELDYKGSLKSEDKFIIETRVKKEGRVRICFEQKITHLKTNKLIIDAKIFAAVLQNGKPINPDSILDIS